MLKKMIFFIVLLLSFHFSIFAIYTENDLIEIMMQEAPEIKSLNLMKEKAYKDYHALKSIMYPQVRYGANAVYVANPVDAINLPTSALSGALGGLGMAGITMPDNIQMYEGSSDFYYGASLSIVQPVFTGGKLVNLTRIGKEAYNINNEAYSLAIKRNKYTLKNAIGTLSYLSNIEESLKLANDDVDELIELSNISAQNGMITNTKSLEAITSGYEVKSGYIRIQNLIKNELLIIESLTGLNNLSIDDIQKEYHDIKEFEDFLNQDRLALISKAISPSQETLKMRDSAEKIASYNKKIADARIFYSPDILLFASFSTYTPKTPLFENGWDKDGNWQGIIGLTLSGTFFDGLRQFRLNDSARLQKEAEKENTKKTIKDIETTFTFALNSLESQISKVKFKEAGLKEKTAAFEDAKLSYESKNISRIDYLIAEVKKATAEVELQEEYLNLLINYYLIKFYID